MAGNASLDDACGTDRPAGTAGARVVAGAGFCRPRCTADRGVFGRCRLAGSRARDALRWPESSADRGHRRPRAADRFRRTCPRCRRAVARQRIRSRRDPDGGRRRRRRPGGRSPGRPLPGAARAGGGHRVRSRDGARRAAGAHRRGPGRDGAARTGSRFRAPVDRRDAPVAGALGAAPARNSSRGHRGGLCRGRTAAVAGPAQPRPVVHQGPTARGGHPAARRRPRGRRGAGPGPDCRSPDRRSRRP